MGGIHEHNEMNEITRHYIPNRNLLMTYEVIIMKKPIVYFMRLLTLGTCTRDTVVVLSVTMLTATYLIYTSK